MGDATDRQLWDGAARGDTGAFAVLFERHATRVYNYCFRSTADWTLAEDLTSIVFLEAWRRRREVRLHGDYALPWLLGVATNVLRNHRRARRRYAAALARVHREHEPAFADDADARVDDERAMRALLGELARLPRREQEVVALCAWSELSYAEAAVALGVPVGTVRSRLSRASARLQAEPALEASWKLRTDEAA